MDIVKSQIVISLAGRDKGRLFFVLDAQADFVLLVDGKVRRLERPKRKKAKHVRFVAESNSRVAEKIRNGEKVLNSEIRKAIAEFSEAVDKDDSRGGN